MKFYQLQCHYAESCFCDRVELPGNSEPLATEPRWNFKADTRRYAEVHGLEDLVFNRTEKSAMATVTAPCKHRTVQHVRITWKLA